MAEERRQYNKPKLCKIKSTSQSQITLLSFFCVSCRCRSIEMETQTFGFLQMTKTKANWMKMKMKTNKKKTTTVSNWSNCFFLSQRFHIQTRVIISLVIFLWNSICTPLIFIANCWIFFVSSALLRIALQSSKYRCLSLNIFHGFSSHQTTPI